MDELVGRTPLAFERRSCGAGSKGERYYDWALAEAAWPSDAGPARKAWRHLLFMRRSIADPGDLAFFAVHARESTTLADLVKVAGMRWGVEDCFETAKTDCGLDQYEVRLWEPWHRHIALALAAFAFLAVTPTRSADQAAVPKDKAGRPEGDGDGEPAITWPPPHLPLPLDSVLH